MKAVCVRCAMHVFQLAVCVPDRLCVYQTAVCTGPARYRGGPYTRADPVRYPGGTGIGLSLLPHRLTEIYMRLKGEVSVIKSEDYVYLYTAHTYVHTLCSPARLVSDSF